MARVTDVDAHFPLARGRGARILHGPADYRYGERQNEIEEIGGLQPTFSLTIADVAPEEQGDTSAVR